MWGLRQGNPGSAGRLRNSWVPKSLEFCKKSVMSTFSEGRKIYFETIFFIQDFFSETSSISTFECAADHQNRFTESIQAPFRVRRPNISLAKLSWFRDPGFSRIFWIWLWNHGFLVSNLTFSNLSNFASFQPIFDWLEVLKPRDFSLCFFLRSHSATITLQFGVSVASNYCCKMIQSPVTPVFKMNSLTLRP